MKQSLLILVLLGTMALTAQDRPPVDIHLQLGSYPVSLAVPSFSPLHPGIELGLSHYWTKHQAHRLIQTGNLGYFYHRDFQKALQLYTEIGYQLRLNNGFHIQPIMIGGGYVLSISDMATVLWDPDAQEFNVDKLPTRHNWMLSLGAGLAYESRLQLWDRPLTFKADYRLQVQGIISQENIPIIAYSPLRIGVSLPLSTVNN